MLNKLTCLLINIKQDKTGNSGNSGNNETNKINEWQKIHDENNPTLIFQ